MPGVPVELPRFIHAMAERLLRSAQAQEVLLFGSYAKGLQNRDSDVDVLVICAEPVARAAHHELLDLLGMQAIRVDLHAVGRSEAVAAGGDPTAFLGSCLSSAVSLGLRPGITSVLAPAGGEMRVS